ncbi:hypothetical protein [Streptomyces hoynatensis]|uniref:Uncharacterized protein n=1 Tax=Streptomyces hoynatensis TaxID=1141874 RepID=A0A3A9YL65_9ACTN|nr:hypothetical protein [Streptomyces hoynatensis]RKN35944.1 hypothetical protein D7294_30405 [Streptomyces hoynatensis]
MTDGYGFNDYSDAGEPDPTTGPKWFRDYMDKVSEQLKDIKAENDRLKTQQRQQAVAEQLRAQGYNPAGASLFTGEPEQLNTWLEAHGDALARLPESPNEGAQEEAPQAPSGPPQSTVPTALQEQMAAMAEAGTSGTAAPQGAEAELVNQLKNASPEEFARIMQANGSPFSW